MERKDVILFHDITLDSGFQTPGALKYKITSKMFWRIIEVFKDLDITKRPIITFDDGGNSVNMKLLEQIIPYFKIVLFIPTNYIGRVGFLSENEISELHEMGVVIGSHSHYHNDGREMDALSFKADWNYSKQILEDITESKIDCCSIPYGKYSFDQLGVLLRLGFENIFTSDNDPHLIDSTLGIESISRLSIDSRFWALEIYFLKVLGISYLRFRSRLIKILLRCL